MRVGACQSECPAFEKSAHRRGSPERSFFLDTERREGKLTP